MAANTCEGLGPDLASLIQRLQTVHTRYLQGRYVDANYSLLAVIADAQDAARALFELHHVSGQGPKKDA